MTEIMSPAGSFESLQAALQGGADAVYFGIEQLNMRARAANNFTLDDLAEIKKICIAKNVRTYLTLNTVMYDHDIMLMKKIIDAAKKNNIDAVIASDHAALMHARKIGMPVHISTQANVSNIESVRFFADYADTIVLARELTLHQVAEVVKQIKRQKIKGPSGKLIKIEVFAHGALCMAVSGKCYLSLHSHNASANRGACIQNCRREYIVQDKENEVELEIDNEYIMSSKDLCTIDFIDKLIETGISILKIEGRGRSADYVYTTTKCYKEAVESYHNGSYTATKVELWKKELATVFNRGFWGGYFLGKTMGEWSNTGGSQATTKKIYVGKGVKYFPKNKVGEFKLESGTLSVDNDIMITGSTTGIIMTKIQELRMDDLPVTTVKKGDVFSMPVIEKIKPSDKLYKIIND
ncbi:MAG TPA: peptidase U32 family protein [Bacteroidia bacterium]|nr:peptidase U32 family protein [Bacteroidia bacterium]